MTAGKGPWRNKAFRRDGYRLAYNGPMKKDERKMEQKRRNKAAEIAGSNGGGAGGQAGTEKIKTKGGG